MQISYNGFDKLRYIKVTEDTTQAVYAQGEAQRLTTRRRMVGTALLSPDGTGSYTKNAAGWSKLYTDARKRLSPNKKALTITADDGSTQIVDISAGDSENNGGDDENGPKVNFQFSEIHGSLSAIVTWQIEWSLLERNNGTSDGTTGDVGDVLSNTFTQVFSRNDGDPFYEWRVTGTLKTRQSAPITQGNVAFDYSTAPTSVNQNPSNQAGIGMHPDAYRRLVMPVLPQGYQWIGMTFTVDDSRTTLQYDLVAKQRPEKTPAPAYSGDADYTISRRLGSGSAIAVKTVTVELVGDSDVDRAELLAAAIEITKSRIKYVGENRDFVNAIEIAELGVMTRNAIRLTVSALVNGEQGGSFGISRSFNNVKVGNLVSSNLSDYAVADPYGASKVRAAVMAIYDPEGDASGNATSLPPHAEFVTVNASAVSQSGDPNESNEGTVMIEADTDADDFTADQNTFPYLDAKIIDRVQVEDTGMVRMAANDASTPDAAFQLTRPRVVIHSVGVATRIGAAPERLFRDPPPGSIVRRDDFDVSAGTSDANANHLYVAKHVRVLELCVDPQNDRFVVANGRVQFWPPEQSISMPRDPRIEHENATEHLFAKADTYEYPVGPPQDYLV